MSFLLDEMGLDKMGLDKMGLDEMGWHQKFMLLKRASEAPFCACTQYINTCKLPSSIRGRLQTIFAKITSLWRFGPHPHPKRHTWHQAKLLVRRRSPLLLTGHYPCVCRNTVRWTTHTELLDDRKLYLLSPEARCQTASSVYTEILLADKTSRG